MNAYMLQSDKRLEPFGDHPGDCLIANKKLSARQKEVLTNLGLELRTVGSIDQIEDPNEYIVFVDSIFFTRELLQEFITKSRQAKGSTVCAVKPGIATLRTVVATQDVTIATDRIEYGLRYIPAQTLRGKDTMPVVFDLDRSYQIIPMPEHMFGESEYRIPLTEKIIIQIDHWTNLWATNLSSLLGEAARLENAPKLKLLGLALKARSVNQWKVMRQINKIGRNCDVHPSAYIEGSTIGDNVTVGARATIREAVIGDNSYLGDNVTIHFSVLGESCNIQSGSLIEFAVLYPGVLSNDRIIAISMCGRNCFIGGNVIFTNFRIDRRSVMVMKGDAMIDTGNSVLGSCVGHDVYLGAGCMIAPGRAIPNGTRLAPERLQVIRKCIPGQDVPGYRRIEIATPDKG
jgi:acetyltransferase-like isoleucine patch superfamily enzyme